jgi:OPT family small oligopeptide transporter
MGLSNIVNRFKENSATNVYTSGAESASGEDIAHADTHLRRVKDQHKWDPYMDLDKIHAVEAAIETGDAEKEAAVEQSILQEDSPYFEVRSAVKPTDDPTAYVDTIRAWVIGALVCTVIGSINVLLYEHYTQVSITSSVVQLIAYPLGTGWAKFMPDVKIFGAPLNPGPFNKKEHTLITMMAAAGTVISYSISILIAQEIFYGQSWGWGFQILLIMSTQVMGFGLAGVMRRFLIWPAAMVWPATLITTSVMDALHSGGHGEPANGWTIGRYRFFMILAGATFFWEWIPNCIAPFLSFLGLFPTWIAPHNVAVNQAFGGRNGLGFIPGTLDWSGVAGFFNNPLQFPGFAIWNSIFGAFLILICGYSVAYGGADFYKYLPLSANKNFDNTGMVYNTSRILNDDLTLNVEAYEEYSPLLIGPVFTMAYALGFAALISTVTHVALFYGKDIWRRTKNAKYEEPDIHLKLMRKYPEAPEWWFMAVFGISFAFAMVASQVWDTKLTWWAFILCVIMGVVMILPVGIIQAITSQQTGLNIITEFIVGYMLPGRPVAMMLFKSWGYMLMANGLTFVSDMKVGHYMKVPPRSMFRAQLFAAVWLSLVQIATYNFLLGNIPEFCSETQPQGFICPGATTFYNASVIWGVVGPKRMFGPGALFAWINWFWLVGFLVTVAHYFVARRYPKSIARYIYFPAIFSIGGMIPPATLWNLSNWLLVGALFNIYIYRKYKPWWSRYTYVTAGALDVGNAICLVLFALGLGLSNSAFPTWWGTTVADTTYDAMRMARAKQMPADGSLIGPKPGDW